jgi:hypothetical protein
MENEPEGGERCRLCYRYRLAATAAKAKELEIDIIATTLTISPRKRPDIINPIGREVCAEAEIRFYEADWKKKDGFKESLDTSRELNLYRQHYCGCKYSLKEREDREAKRAALEPAAPIPTSDSAPAVNRVTKAMRILAEDLPKAKPDPGRETDTRAKWELSPLERKKRHDKKPKPWARE